MCKDRMGLEDKWNPALNTKCRHNYMYPALGKQV